jgi:2-dehydropantoate 2-reductase
MNTFKQIFVIGAGAIGKVLATLLTDAGRNVSLLRASSSDIPIGSEKINMTVEGGWNITATVNVSPLEKCRALDGIIALTSKSYGNRDVVEKLKSRIGNSPIVILQNGLAVEDIFLNELSNNVYRCVLFATSQFGPSAELHFKPVSASLVGIARGNESELKDIIQSLNSPMFPFAGEDDIQRVVWKKSIINCVFNSICPLLETDNGIFHRNAEALLLAKTTVDQCVKVANVANIKLTTEETIESLLTISKFSDGQLISTYQDILNGRETEIDTLNLAVAAIAAKTGNADLVRETKLLGDLTRLKAAIFREKAGR